MGQLLQPGVQRQPAAGRSPFLVEVLKVSPQALSDIKTASRLGISTRRLAGWEPQTVTRFVYDERDRIAETISTPEPEFDELEAAIQLAFDEVQETTCPGCGGDLTETLTNKHPSEDDPGFYHQFEPWWCRDCVGHSRFWTVQHKQDEAYKGTVLENHPDARRVRSWRVPLPAEDSD